MHVDAVCTHSINSSSLLKKYMHDPERAWNDPSFYPHPMLDSFASDSLPTVTKAESSPTLTWQTCNGRFYSNGRKGNLPVWTSRYKQGCRERVRVPVKKKGLPTRPNRLEIFTSNQNDCLSVRGRTWTWSFKGKFVQSTNKDTTEKDTDVFKISLFRAPFRNAGPRWFVPATPPPSLSHDGTGYNGRWIVRD